MEFHRCTHDLTFSNISRRLHADFWSFLLAVYPDARTLAQSQEPAVPAPPCGKGLQAHFLYFHPLKVQHPALPLPHVWKHLFRIFSPVFCLTVAGGLVQSHSFPEEVAVHAAHPVLSPEGRGRAAVAGGHPEEAERWVSMNECKLRKAMGGKGFSGLYERDCLDLPSMRWGCHWGI